MFPLLPDLIAQNSYFLTEPALSNIAAIAVSFLLATFLPPVVRTTEPHPLLELTIYVLIAASLEFDSRAVLTGVTAIFLAHTTITALRYR